jgi:hypothetical protein
VDKLPPLKKEEEKVKFKKRQIRIKRIMHFNPIALG